MVGAEGFEPSNTGSKGRRLTAWPRPNTPGPGAPAPRTLRRGVETLIVAEFTEICPTWRAALPGQVRSHFFAEDTYSDKRPTLRAYSRRLSVRVCSDSHPGRARSLAVRLAASARSNRPKTADPEPDMAANVAPASSNDCRIREIAG